MKKIIFLLIIVVLGVYTSTAQQLTPKEQSMVNALETLDNDIVKYFPRWKVCEPSLQIHIYATFVSAGYKDAVLDRNDIEVLAAPGDFDPEYGYYTILLLSCGDAALSPSQINTYCTPKIRRELSGEWSFSGTGYGRTYCYKEIPPEVPVSQYQADAIINYYQPTDVNHAISLSLFEQNLKLGETGFWLRSVFGNDEAGYQFWTSGQYAIELQRPLYINKDPNTNSAIPYLVNFYIGGGYRVSTGINPGGTLFSWVPNRILNGSKSGDVIFGANFYLPVMPELGVSLHARLPFEALKSPAAIETSKWGKMSVPEDRVGDIYSEIDPSISVTDIIPMMHSSGKLSIFYNWWVNSKNPENYIRADLGICYVETREVAMYQNPSNEYEHLVAVDGINGLKTYKPSEAMDWLYFKVEYRNQATWPFGASLQIANQTLLGNVWVPILGNWLLIEMKYSTVLRDPRPYEIKNFLMFSPVIRITI